MTIEGKAVLITGANRGIGRALVEEALRRGAQRVYAGTRRPFAHPDERVSAVMLDVTNTAQIEAKVHAVLTGPTDTDMTRGFEIPKASPESVARAIFDGVEEGDEEIFPDPTSEVLAESWHAGMAKALVHEYAAFVQEQAAA